MGSNIVLVAFCGMVLFFIAFYQIRRIQEDMVNIADGRALYIERRDIRALRDSLVRGDSQARRRAPPAPGGVDGEPAIASRPAAAAKSDGV